LTSNTGNTGDASIATPYKSNQGQMASSLIRSEANQKELKGVPLDPPLEKPADRTDPSRCRQRDFKTSQVSQPDQVFSRIIRKKKKKQNSDKVKQGLRSGASARVKRRPADGAAASSSTFTDTLIEDKMLFSSTSPTRRRRQDDARRRQDNGQLSMEVSLGVSGRSGGK